MMEIDGHLFDTFPLDTRIDRDKVINSIILRSGRSYPKFQDTRIFKVMVNAWFSNHSEMISDLYETSHYDYNPIENYNRMETGKRSGTNNITTGNEINATKNYTDEHETSAFDSTNYQKSGKDTYVENSGSNEQGNENGTTNENYENRVHGNIGVTTSQRMIKEQRNVVRFSVYDWIAAEIDIKFFYGLYNSHLGR